MCLSVKKKVQPSRKNSAEKSCRKPAEISAGFSAEISAGNSAVDLAKILQDFWAKKKIFLRKKTELREIFRGILVNFFLT